MLAKAITASKFAPRAEPALNPNHPNHNKPVPNMMKRIKIWIEMGYRVKIVTARAQDPELAIPPIQKWLKKHGLPDLEITNSKDMDMIELWDDRCVQVIPNTGNPVGPASDPYRVK